MESKFIWDPIQNNAAIIKASLKWLNTTRISSLMLKIDPIKIANIKIITNIGNLTLAFSLLEMLKNIINWIKNT